MRRVTERLNSMVEAIGMIFLVIMLLIVSMQVITRLTIKTTPRWAEEVAIILMVWFGFLGMTVGVKERTHIAITFFVDRMSGKIKKVILIIDELLAIFFGSGLFWYGSKLIYETRRSTLPATKWPAYTPYLMLPVAGAIIILHCIVNISDIMQSKNERGLEG